MPLTSLEELNEIALQILTDEGQVTVSVMVDEGDIRRAQLYLFREIGGLTEAGQLTLEESQELINRLGFTTLELRQLRTGELV